MNTAPVPPPEPGETHSLQRLARALCRLSTPSSPALSTAVTMLLRAASEGHTCLDLRLAESGPVARDTGHWCELLLQCGIVGAPGSFTPLILDGSRLYLHRFRVAEDRLVGALRERARDECTELDDEAVRRGCRAAFVGERGPRLSDAQKRAVVTALTRRLCVVTGGPGTGKTTTVAAILTALEAAEPSRPPRTALTAPTGKAAARMQEALRDGMGDRGASPEALTVHRLLGAGRGFRYHADNPLPFDLVVLDEASMIDLSLCSRLLDALTRRCRLVILGDRNQLASVQAGAVLGDLCRPVALNRFSDTARRRFHAVGASAPEAGIGAAPPLADCIVELTTAHRFNREIGALADAVREGAFDTCMQVIEQSPRLSLRPLPPPSGLRSTLGTTIREGFRPYLAATEFAGKLRAFTAFRLLCAVRQGPWGAVRLNAAVGQLLAESEGLPAGEPLYENLPVLITRNDYHTGLYNGDIGFVYTDSDRSSGLRVQFPSPAGGRPRTFSPSRLASWEPAFALTVHKSQGSEFDRVLLLLPEIDSPLLSRELIYTAVTRARHSVEIRGSGEILRAALRRTTERGSGLGQRLWME